MNRGERLSSPYALTITRSLPSLVGNDADSESIVNMLVGITSYVVRGSGTSSHYEYEVRVVTSDDSWTLLRRYRRFRELYVSMREKYGSKVCFNISINHIKRALKFLIFLSQNFVFIYLYRSFSFITF